MQGSKIKKIVSVDDIDHWKDDSLYISGDDMDVFFSHYNEIFNGGIHSNRESGPVDLFGVNYYSPKQSAVIIEQVLKRQPLDYQALLNWLNDVKKYNGFYVLGE